MVYIGAALLGFLLGLAYCYWKTIKAVYENKDLLMSGANLATSAQDFYANLQKL